MGIMRSARGAEQRKGRAFAMAVNATKGSAAKAAKPKARTSLLAAAFVLALLLLVGFQLLSMRDQLASARAQEAELAGRVARQEQENRAIEAALERAEDPEYLQELAREQLGMVSPGQKDFYDVSN